jgi:ATP-dependent DNA ligase
VQLCAFDVLAIDGENLRELPLSMRNANLERLLRGRRYRARPSAPSWRAKQWRRGA